MARGSLGGINYDLQAIKQAAATYGPAMTKFYVRSAFPGESAEEKIM